MTTTRALCLSLEFDFEGERVTGWLADEQGNDWAFSSWLDLLTLIERVLASGRSAADREEQVDGSQRQMRPARDERNKEDALKGASG
jgi:hypothetical protein